LVLLLAFLHYQNRQNQRHQLVLLLGQLEQAQEQRVLLVRDCPVLIYIF
jgi:type II secretory pathway pseudopilin PulG